MRWSASSAIRAPLAALVGERLELAAARGHRGELGADEEGVRGEQEHGDEDRRHASALPGPPDAAPGAASGRRPGVGAHLVVVALVGRRAAVRSRRIRSTRCPSMSTTRAVHPSASTASPTAGTRPSVAMTQPPTVSYAGPSGMPAPTRLRTSSGRHRPGTVHEPSGRRRPVVCERSCSSLTSPTISSTRSSSVDHAGRAAVLVDHDGELHPALAQLEEQRVEAQGLGDEHGLHHERRHGHVAAAAEGHGDGLLDVHDAVDVVPVRADDGEARVTGDPRQRDEVGRCRGAVDRRRPRAGRHDVGRGLVGEAEGCRDEPRRAEVEGAGLGGRAHEGRQLGGAAGGGQLLLRLDAERDERAVRDAVEQGDHRLCRDAEPAHRAPRRPWPWRGAARSRGSWAPSRRRSSRTPSR